MKLNEVMQQIDLCNVPEVGGFKQLAACIDNFSKWSEAKTVIDKSPSAITNFLYKVICCYGSMRIQINDQGREFESKLNDNLHQITRIEQRIIFACHP